ncbi:Predicted AAA-ATPase [bacterium A37T11]|nr:Predicted AAA-ATPase [bacterium A37T11]
MDKNRFFSLRDNTGSFTISVFNIIFAAMMKDLPVGQPNFEDLRKDNGVYVDKTAYIFQLISGAKRVDIPKTESLYELNWLLI